MLLLRWVARLWLRVTPSLRGKDFWRGKRPKRLPRYFESNRSVTLRARPCAGRVCFLDNRRNDVTMYYFEWLLSIGPLANVSLRGMHVRRWTSSARSE